MWIKEPMEQGIRAICLFINGCFYSLNPRVIGNGRVWEKAPSLQRELRELGGLSRSSCSQELFQ